MDNKEMKIFLVSRTDKVEWCEDMETIIVACDEKWAEKIARLSSRDFRKSELCVKEIDLSKEGAVLTTNKGA